ncbi:hypothetical protein BV25DRAFT_1821837 [Artomyces pyxidatus]|uniref:Uncharacterized protein n=1 Tax=Artomyces pyxidatus TaxID=48021 RepID=A0ACB8TA26_9AGAM|nr:hypothetical protein BV25DRAFT_1821837 [Artomyces pyxidatus]
MNTYKLWKPEARLDYSTDHPRTKAPSIHHKTPDSRPSRADGKHQTSSRGYVSDSHTPRAPAPTYASNSLPSNRNPHVSQQQPASLTHRVTASAPSASYTTPSHPHKPDVAYDPRAYPSRAVPGEKAGTSSRDQVRVPEDHAKSSRHRTQTSHSSGPGVLSPPEAQKVSTRLPSGEKERQRDNERLREAERLKEAERSRHEEKAREKERGDRARAEREAEINRYEEERQRRREERRKQKEEKRREEENQKAREDYYRQEQSRELARDRERRREVREGVNGASHLPGSSRESRHRVKESDESDNSMRKPVPSLRHRHHHREPATGATSTASHSHGILPSSAPQAAVPAQVLGNHSDNIPLTNSRPQTTPLQTPTLLPGNSTDRTTPRQRKTSHAQNEAVPYPPGYAVSGSDNEYLSRKDRPKYQEPVRIGGPGKAVTTQTPPDPGGARSSTAQHGAIPAAKASKKPEKQSKGLGWLFHRSSEALPQKPPDNRYTSRSSPPQKSSASTPSPPSRHDHESLNPPQIVSIKASQGPSDQIQYERSRKHSTQGASVPAAVDAVKHMQLEAAAAQTPYSMQPLADAHVRSRPPTGQRADPHDRSPAPSTAQTQAWGTAPPPWSLPSPVLPPARLPAIAPPAEIVRPAVSNAVSQAPYSHADPSRSTALASSSQVTPPAPAQGGVPSSDQATWGSTATVTNGRPPIPTQSTTPVPPVPGTRQRTSPQGLSANLNATSGNRADVSQGRQPYSHEQSSPRYLSAPQNGAPAYSSSYGNGVAPPPPYQPVGNPRTVIPDLASAFPINEDAIDAYHRPPSFDHTYHPPPDRVQSHHADAYGYARDVNGRHDTRPSTAPGMGPTVDSRPVRSTKTPSPGHQSRSVPQSTPPRATVQPIPTPTAPPQNLPGPNYLNAHDPSRPNVYGSVPAYPAPSSYPLPSPRSHLDANSAFNSNNVPNTSPPSYTPSPKAGQINPSPRSQTYPVNLSHGAPPNTAVHVTSRTPSYDTGSTTLLGHTPSSQNSLPIPSASPAVHAQNFSPYPGAHNIAQPVAPGAGQAHSHGRSQSASVYTPPQATRQSSSRHQPSASVPSPALPSNGPSASPGSQVRAQSQPNVPRVPVSPMPVRSFSTTQAVGDPYGGRVPISGHPSTPAPVRGRRRPISSMSMDSDVLNTPSSLAHSNLKLPDSSDPMLPVSSQSYQEPKKKSGFFGLGLFRSRSTGPKQQQAGHAQTKAEEARAQQPSSGKLSSSKTSLPLQYESDSKVVSMSSSKKKSAQATAPVPTPVALRAPVPNPSADKRSAAQNPFAPFRLLSGKRHRTMSGASAEAVDGTNAGASTVLTSPAGSTRSPTPKLQRDPVQAAHEWRNKEEAVDRDRGKMRRRRPGVHFEGYEDHPQAERHKPNYASRARSRQ